MRDTDPPGTEQGTVDLQVRILGSGFEHPAHVRFLMDGDTTGIATSDTADFISSSELITTITVDADAQLGLWDVEVELLSNRRKGIGIELFQVTNPGIPGAGNGGKVATIAMSGGYSTSVDQLVGFEERGKAIRFEATTEHKINYLLDLPPYGGDDICVASELAVGQTAEEFWNEFIASQNEVTSRSFRFNYRLDNKMEENRTEGFYVTQDGRGRWFKAGTTNALGLDVNSTITPSTDDASGNDVYTLTEGALQVRFLGGGSVTCPNPVSFTLTAEG